MANKKIPYDVAPISRDYSTPSSRRHAPSKTSFSAGIFILAILIFNIVLGVITISTIASHKNSNIMNVTNNVSVSGADVAYATGKAKMSSVCVAVDSRGTYSRTNLPNKRQFFSNTTERGSGTIYKLDKTTGVAYIITCNHVVSSARNNAFVLLYDADDPVYASVVGYSSSYDVAVLEVQDDSLKTTMCTETTVADSAFIAEGQTAIAIGNPLSGGFNASTGIISKTLTSYTTSSGAKRGIQIDTPVNSGNSGGGLFDKNGNFIGVVQSKNDASTTDNIAFAVPANIAVSITNNIVEGRNLAYASIGYTVYTETIVKLIDGQYYKMSNVYVDSVLSADAISAGLAHGDKIISISYHGKTKEVISDFSYEEIKFDLIVGDVLEYRVQRGNDIITLRLNVTSVSTGT